MPCQEGNINLPKVNHPRKSEHHPCDQVRLDRHLAEGAPLPIVRDSHEVTGFSTAKPIRKPDILPMTF